jgi:signal transduction histidine kinase
MLITDILESERMKSGHAALERSNVNLAELAASVVNELQAIELNVDIAHDLPLLSLDSTRVHILLRNILSNALTHGINTDQHPTLSISRQTEKEQVIIEVSDHGPGIPSEHIDAVTEPFYRIDGSRTRKTGGFGLGLHLAKLIAEAHGGTLMVRSRTLEENSESGTTILVMLPIQVSLNQ